MLAGIGRRAQFAANTGSGARDPVSLSPTTLAFRSEDSEASSVQWRWSSVPARRLSRLVFHFDVHAMDKEFTSTLVQCSWDGDPAGWSDFVRRVRLLYERTARRKRRQIGPSVVAQLKDKAWTITQEIDHHKLTRRDGAVYLLEFLRDRLGRSPVPDIGIRLEELMIRLKRSPGTPMSSWASQVRQTYKRVQIALHRARKEKQSILPESSKSPTSPPKNPSSPSSPSSASRRGQGSPARRGSEATQATQEEPQAEAEIPQPPDPETDSLLLEEDDGEMDPGADPRSSWRTRRKKVRADDDDDSDDSAAALADLEVWDRYEEGLEEVLPGEVSGWLLLRRANLPTSARLSIQAAAGNSLLFTDIERAMRSMEDELMIHDDSRRAAPARRRSFWVEDEGEWSLIMAPEDEMQEIMAANEVHYVGARLPPEVYYQEPDPFNFPEDQGFWHHDEEGGYTYWELAEDGEYYTQDMTGLFWAWSEWEEQVHLASAPSEPSKPSEETFSVTDPKSRSFTQARQAVKAKNLSRGFYPFNPSLKGKPRFKGKGKGKGRGKVSGFRPAVAPVLAATSEVYAQPGDPSFTGCFVCGSKEHGWRACPKRASGSKGPGKGKQGRAFFTDGVFMVQDLKEDDRKAPGYMFKEANPGESDAVVSSRSPGYGMGSEVLDFRWLQDSAEEVISSFAVTSHSDAFTSGNSEPHPRGHAVVDSGATETVGSLPAIEDLMRHRFELHGRPDDFKISDVPIRRFRFGNGSLGFSMSHMLIPQELGNAHVDLGIYSLDVENVPILLGIRTLRSLKTVLDFEKDIAVFAALNPYVGIPLRRSSSGHVLINLSQNWLQDSFSLTDPAATFDPSEQPGSCDKEDPIGAIFVIENECPEFRESPLFQRHVASAPSEPSALPAVLFHSRGEVGETLSLDRRDEAGESLDSLWVLRNLVRRHVCEHPGQDCRGCDCAGQGHAGGSEIVREGQGKGEESPKASGRTSSRARLGPHPRGRRARCAPSRTTMQPGARCDLPVQPACHLDVLPEMRSQDELHPEDREVSTPSECRAPSCGHQAGGERDCREGGPRHNPRLKDAAIGLQAAENSALKQLERIRMQKAKVLPALKPDDQKVGKAPGTPTTPPKSSAAPASSSPDASSPGSGVILIEEPPPANPEDLPGNKRHQGMTAEEQEYQSRTTT